MMLKKIGVKLAGRIAQLGPGEAAAALGAARLAEPAQIVAAQRTMKGLIVHPRRRCGLRNTSRRHRWIMADDGKIGQEKALIDVSKSARLIFVLCALSGSARGQTSPSTEPSRRGLFYTTFSES